MPKLESEVMRSIRALCEHGDTLVSMKEYTFAVSKYFEALALIPDPKKEYKAATWIYTSIGETYWKLKNYNDAGMAFLNAVKSVGGADSARVNLRLGECLFECGDTVHSSEYLCQAYMIDGAAAFSGEDPKYFDAIRHEVEGAPDDDDFDEDYGKDDYYLVDNMLGGSPRPVRYVDESEPEPEPEPEPDNEPEDEYSYEQYDRGYYGDDAEPADDGSDRSEYYGEDETADYFDDDDYDDYDDDDYEESPIKRLVDKIINFFSR